MADQATWQEFFDSRFPEGALVIFVANAAAAAMSDDSPQILTMKIFVSGVDEEGDSPSIVFTDVDTDRQFFFDVETAEPSGEGRLTLTLADLPGRQLIVSPNLTGEQKEIVKTRKKGMWGT